MKLDAIGAVTLFVEDVARSKKFYGEVFGLPVTNEDDESVLFTFGPTFLNLLVEAGAPELIAPAKVGTADSGARSQLTIWVPDADAACAHLAEHGVSLLNGPVDRPWGQRTAAFADPDGHVWELAQHL